MSDFSFSSVCGQRFISMHEYDFLCTCAAGAARVCRTCRLGSIETYTYDQASCTSCDAHIAPAGNDASILHINHACDALKKFLSEHARRGLPRLRPGGPHGLFFLHVNGPQKDNAAGIGVVIGMTWHGTRTNGILATCDTAAVTTTRDREITVYSPVARHCPHKVRHA